MQQHPIDITSPRFLIVTVQDAGKENYSGIRLQFV